MEFSFSIQSTYIFANTRKTSKQNSYIKTINPNSKSLNLKERVGPHSSMKQNFVIQRQVMAIILSSISYFFIYLDYCIFYKKIFKCFQNGKCKSIIFYHIAIIYLCWHLIWVRARLTFWIEWNRLLKLFPWKKEEQRKKFIFFA